MPWISRELAASQGHAEEKGEDAEKIIQSASASSLLSSASSA
jgi:hypothetical protein